MVREAMEGSRAPGSVRVRVGASRGELLFLLEWEGVSSSPVLLPAEHSSLLYLSSLLEGLGGAEVLIDPGALDPGGSGLPVHVDVEGLVEAALSLSRLGWHSCPGGEA